jgi:hypothetical protein
MKFLEADIIESFFIDILNFNIFSFLFYLEMVF